MSATARCCPLLPVTVTVPLTVRYRPLPTPHSSRPRQAFKEAWAEFDPDADQKIPAVELANLVLQLPPPMGLQGKTGSWGQIADKRMAMRMCMKLRLEQKHGEVEFHAVLQVAPC